MGVNPLSHTRDLVNAPQLETQIQKCLKKNMIHLDSKLDSI